ncbi:RNA-binding protein [Ancylomarina sp. 16SWW S1-10-2]|nr:RNA-binding protein [Ancylomarina sp. 16SWW S1-10-2]
MGAAGNKKPKKKHRGKNGPAYEQKDEKDVKDLFKKKK